MAAVEAALQNNDLSLDEINKVLAMNKAMDGGKVRGMKDLQKILDEYENVELWAIRMAVIQKNTPNKKKKMKKGKGSVAIAKAEAAKA